MATNRLMMRSILLLFILLLMGCTVDSDKKLSQRGVYYWRTVFEPDSVELAFLHEHQIKKLYLRYFDVVQNESGEAVPNATLTFRSPRPEGVEVVPTVFIMNDCMTNPPQDLAEKLLQRVLQMSDTNDMGPVKELQVDCDWTARTRQRYYDFLQQLRTLAKAEEIVLSATIRLHQLSQPVPPVDRGVLMVYNTGDVTDLKCEHPILDMADVQPYLRNLKHYKLPMSAAYPLFTWKVLFRRDHFVGILHSDDEYPVLPSDSIVVRQPDKDQIMEAHDMIGKLRSDLHDEVILYDLQRKNIIRFNSEDYEEIYHY